MYRPNIFAVLAITISSVFLWSCSKSKDFCVSSTSNVSCYDYLPDSSGSCPAGTKKVSSSADLSPCIYPAKPVIYLYPEKETDVLVKLDFQGNLTATYPEFDPILGGWNVVAYPDGRIINRADKMEYSYIFWEGKSVTPINNFSSGFVVPGAETRSFLQRVLPEIGLTPREYNEFIVYWYPLMKNNPYNLIHFEGELYEQTARLSVTPTPDSMLRVFMTYRPLSTWVDVKPQLFPTFVRKGFTVVEWGGSQVK